MPRSEFLQACARGDVATVRACLVADPALAGARDDDERTGLHLAARHPDVLRVLLMHGVDPNARERDDNATPLHLAAANGQLESVQVLIDGGADVHGAGDLHDGDVIGWAAGSGNRALVDLLVARGARHHVFSAMALRDADLVRQVVADDPRALQRRRSRFENHHTPVHAAFAAADGIGLLAGSPDYDMLALLIELGADVDAPDDRGRTPLDVAFLRGDVTAMRMLSAAGARASEGAVRSDVAGDLAALSGTVVSSEPTFSVDDARATIDWYRSLGFTLVDAYEDDGAVVFARLQYGQCHFALSRDGRRPANVSLWVMTTAVDAIYELVKARQLGAARAAMAGLADASVPFEEDLYTPFYGGRQFSVRDPNGVVVVFYQRPG